MANLRSDGVVMERGTEYELFTQEVCRLIAEYQNLGASSVKQNVKLKGKSGVLHQVDVYWVYEDRGEEHRVAIECKNYCKRVSIARVRDFYGVISDLENVKGIMVTTVGYQKGAKKFADYYGIALKQLRTPRDGESVIGECVSRIEGDCQSCIYLVDEDWAVQHNIDISAYRRRLDCIGLNSANRWTNSRYVPLDTIDNLIKDAKGNILSSINELEQREPDLKPDDDSAVYIFDDAYIMTRSWAMVKIKEVKLERKSFQEQHTYSIDAGEFVRAIIEDAKDEKKMAVLKFV